MDHLDLFDRKILAALQDDGRLSNAELAQIAGLSASQCSRRRTRLEETGVIVGYRAVVDPERVGIGVTCIISLNLSNHTQGNAERLRRQLGRLDNVQEVYSLTGDMDYSIKVVMPDLKSLSQFINETLLPFEAVQSVRTSIVLDTVKQTSRVPVA